MREMQVCLGSAFANSSYQFNVTGGGSAANVYQDGNLTTPFPITGFVSSDTSGRFPPIYLDPSIIYQVVFTAQSGYTWTRDPYVPPLTTLGTSQNTSYGMRVAPTGEFTVTAPNSGGSGISMILKAGQLGSAAIKVTGTAPGTSAIIVNNSATTGAQTATFAATNKPGTATSPPAGWLPITCDGVQYYTPIWHGNAFEYYFVNPSAVGETINASSVTFNGNGSTTPASGGTATPGSWFLPNTVNIGAGYYITVTPTPGQGNLSGEVFWNGLFPAGAPLGTSPVNISSGGLTISANAAAQLVGSYTLSTSATGSPVVAGGSITLVGGNGPTSAAYSVVNPLNVATNGTTTDGNNNAQANWYSPTTGGIGSSYWISVNQTGGTSGFAFTGVSTTASAPTSMASPLVIGITPSPIAPAIVSGTYTISTDSGGVNIVATGSLTLNGGTDVQSPNWNGTPVLNLAGNGAATLNGASTSSWYSPNTANVGSGYWIDINRTSGTTGVNFSAAQGSYTNISNSGLNIGLTSYTGDVGTVTVSGTWFISNSSSGSPTLGSGTITLSVTGLTLIHVYTSGSSATETIPTGASSATIENWGGGGGGGGGWRTGSGCGLQISSGGGGGAGGYCRTSATVTGHSGQTIKYTVGGGGAGGAANSGSTAPAGGTSTVTKTGGTFSGTLTTMTAGGGGGGVGGNGDTPGAAGAGGSASGGAASNVTGHAGSSSTGGAGTTGTVSGDGSPYGAGGTGGSGAAGANGHAGSGGAVVFYYT